jgi:hypothetical protein
MNKLELLKRIAQVNSAINSNDYGQLALALGMSKPMIEEMSLQDIMEAMTVRLSDLNKELEKVLNHE